MSIMEIFAEMLLGKKTAEETYAAIYQEITGDAITPEEAKEALKPYANATAAIPDEHDLSGLVDEY